MTIISSDKARGIDNSHNRAVLREEFKKKVDPLIENAIKRARDIPLSALQERADNLGNPGHSTFDVPLEKGPVAWLKTLDHFAGLPFSGFYRPNEEDINRHLEGIEELKAAMKRNGITIDTIGINNPILDDTPKASSLFFSYHVDEDAPDIS